MTASEGQFHDLPGGVGDHGAQQSGGVAPLCEGAKNRSQGKMPCQGFIPDELRNQRSQMSHESQAIYKRIQISHDSQAIRKSNKLFDVTWVSFDIPYKVFALAK